MGRRAQKPELEFGSDSFLDVVCNIVGILIILIVIVAVKVERQPQAVSVAEATAASRPDDDARLAERQQEMVQMHESTLQLNEEFEGLQSESSAADQTVQQLTRGQELAKQQMEAEQAERSRLLQQQKELESDQRVIAARIATLQQSIDSGNANTLKLGQALATASSSELELDEKLRTTVVETLKLQEVLAQTQLAAVPKDRLEHRLSPVTKAVETQELHFRVENGRVSQIPIDELLKRLKAQVLVRRSTVMRFSQFEGTVGPVGGYNMTYIVEKEGPTTLDALQSGDGRTRFNVTRWTITSDDALADESVEEAIKPGSRYRQIVETAPPDTVVTMWIYPDSFRGYSALREVGHGLRLRVAARPLPAGTPIVGSPNGSRSRAQ